MQPVHDKDDADSDLSSEDEPIEPHQMTPTTTVVTRTEPVNVQETSPEGVSEERLNFCILDLKSITAQIVFPKLCYISSTGSLRILSS